VKGHFWADDWKDSYKQFDIKMDVQTPSGTNLMVKEDILKGLHHDKRPFGFATRGKGRYTVCFSARAKPDAMIQSGFTVRVGFTILHQTSEEAKVSSTHVSALHDQLKRIEDDIHTIADNLVYLKYREAKMRDTSESTGERALYFPILTVCVLFILGMWQSFHLSSFLQEKKIV